MGTATCLPGLRPERGSEAGGGGRVPLTCARGGGKSAGELLIPVKAKSEERVSCIAFLVWGVPLGLVAIFACTDFHTCLSMRSCPKSRTFKGQMPNPRLLRETVAAVMCGTRFQNRDNSGLLEVAASLGDLRFCRLHLVLQAPCSGLLNLSEGSHESCTVIPGKLSTPCFAATLKADHAEL